jgi:hypothetical protein
MRTKYSVFIITMLTILFCLGCKKDKSNPTYYPPSQEFLNVDGTWDGVYSSNLVGNTAGLVVLNQNIQNVSGTLTTIDGTSSISGTVTTTEFHFDMNQTIVGCVGLFSGAATVSGDNMTLSFTGTDCLGDHVGAGVFVRQ